MAILFYCPWDNSDQWLAALRSALPDDDFRVWPDVGDPEEIDFAMVWKIPPGVLAGFPNLLAIASLGAGVDALVDDPDLPRNVPVTRLVDPLMADRMAEYVCATVLHHHLGLDNYGLQQSRKHWQRHPTTDARDRTVALLGLGQMGQRCAQRLAALGFNLLGWSRSAREIAGIRCSHGLEALKDVLRQAEIAVLLLPLTERTVNLMDQATFSAMPEGGYLINCSRGECVVEDDLLAALDSGHLAGATLDAFRDEPLAAHSPLWRHPKVRITPHIASLSAAGTAAPILADQVRRARGGQPVADRVDIDNGY
ncbi:MAG: glyoxylate/hydroxypyruvate reductase A [Alphaproteobacteria bacterium]|nr:glyoxylate/hydroxypyruvate reductase A [Alphaproteobacteria bacterium]